MRIGTDWAAAAADLTDCARRLAARNDLIVVCVGDDSQRERGLFHRDSAKITLNTDRLLPGADARDVHFGSPEFRARHPHVMGVLLHEIGHADHTLRRGMQRQAIAHWLTVLEEPRVEHAMLGAHPSARRWLQTSAALTIPQWVRQTRDSAAEATILFGGRVAAGILSRVDVAEVLATARTILGTTDFHRILTIVDSTLSLADTELDAIRDAALAVDRIVDPDGGAEAGDGQHVADADTADVQRPMQNASGDMAAQIVQLPSATTDTYDASPEWVWRAPTSAETAQVSTIVGWRHGQTTPARQTTIVNTAAPPGRLRTGVLVERSAQRAAGLPVTAEPFRRRRRQALPASPIEAGIIVDCSGSMRRHLDTVAGASWVLAHAFGADRLARIRTWTFDESVQMLPTDTAQVAVPKVGGATRMLPAALDTYRSWSLAVGSPSKVLVVISDGRMRDKGIRSRLQQIAAAGTRVLWLFPQRQLTTIAGAPIDAGIHPISLVDNGAQLPLVVSVAVMCSKDCSANSAIVRNSVPHDPTSACGAG